MSNILTKCSGPIPLPLSFQGLVNVLKSLVDWERSRKESQNLRKSNQHEGVSADDSVEIRSRDDVTSDFGKAKAHKTTLEAAVAEVTNCLYFKVLNREGKI